MPIIKSAIKRMRQTAIRKDRNVTTKKNIKSAVKAFLAAPTAAGLRQAQSEIDTAVKKNVLKKNTAARRKSNLVRVAKNAGVKNETVAVAKPATKASPKKAAAKTVAAEEPATKTVKKPAAKKTSSTAAAKKSA